MAVVGQEETHDSGVRDRSAHGRRPAEWNKLRTPVLPDASTVKATPVVLARKPPIPHNRKKLGNQVFVIFNKTKTMFLAIPSNAVKK